MKKIIGILLIVAGVIVFYMGWSRKDSLAGEAASAGASVAHAVDGGVHTTQHTTYMIVGGVLTLVGIGVVASSRSVTRL